MDATRQARRTATDRARHATDAREHLRRELATPSPACAARTTSAPGCAPAPSCPATACLSRVRLSSTRWLRQSRVGDMSLSVVA
jgi:hypothetical protein